MSRIDPSAQSNRSELFGMQVVEFLDALVWIVRIQHLDFQPRRSPGSFSERNTLRTRRDIKIAGVNTLYPRQHQRLQEHDHDPYSTKTGGVEALAMGRGEKNE
ncbi:hypothetical protein GCM10023333_05960 [Ferrimonas pelagia]|uniref:Uncharacterized protein n=1 Tax=Ferrimonas pelagia TaxID=1177826 RepID=A0ABP9EDX8_9GAMM